MNTVELLRYAADNIEAGRNAEDGLLFAGGECAPSRTPNEPSLILSMSSSYTIAPVTHTVNGFEVAKPITVIPSERDPIFFISLSATEHYQSDYWTGSNIDYRLFNRSLLFKTPEDAAANAKAMLGINPNEEC